MGENRQTRCRSTLFLLLIAAGSIFIIACQTPAENTGPIETAGTATPVASSDDLRKAIRAVEPFFKPMETPDADEWLASFQEGGQTFEQYISGNPTLPTDIRRTIYVQPIGKFSVKQAKVIKITAEYLGNFFGLPVKLMEAKRFKEPMSVLNYRFNPLLEHKQVRTGYILDRILLPSLPADAAALIAFTNEDLYPDESMNYLFGQASLENRVGVWSLYWLDNNADFDTFLKRTLKIAAHETGHMFSIMHCTKYECVMSGTNHLRETDSRPIDACPECMAKICWMTKTAPQKRYAGLATFSGANGLMNDEAEFKKKAAAVAAN